MAEGDGGPDNGGGSRASGTSGAPGDGRQAGWREVLLVSIAVVAVVLGAAVATSLLPAEVQAAIFGTPILIAILIGGTAWLLWRIARGRPATHDDGADRR